MEAKEYPGLSLKEIYINHCRALKVKPNSKLLKEIGTTDAHISLDMGGNYLGTMGFQAFLEIVRLSKKLRRLVLTDNGLNNDAIAFMCRVASTHPSLTSIDLSDNPLSMFAGQCLLDLARNNHNIINIELQSTSIDEKLVGKIESALELNSKIGSLNDPNTPFRLAKRHHEEKRKQKEKNADSKKETQKNITDSLDDFAVRLETVLQSRKIEMPERNHEGWVIINIYICSTKHDFISELDIIHNKIIPTLNERLATRRIFLHPVSLYYDPEEGSRGSSLREQEDSRKNSMGEVLKMVDQCSPFFIGLLGDKHGWAPQVFQSEYDDLKRLLSPPYTNVPISVMEVYRGGALTQSPPLSMFFLRKSAQHLKIPEGVLLSMTDESRYAHPDPEGNIRIDGIEGTRYGAGIRVAHISNDPLLLRQRWKLFLEMKKIVLRTTSSVFLTNDYPARFHSVDDYGNVLLTHLDEFEVAFATKLWHSIEHFYPLSDSDVAPSPWKNVNAYEKETKKFINSPAPLVGQRTPLDRIESYIAAPSSRNILVVAYPGGAGATTLLRHVAHRQQGIVAVYFANNSVMCDEAWDLRCCLLTLARQLTGALPQSIIDSIQLSEVKRFFLSTLQNVSQQNPNSIVLIVIDGLEALKGIAKLSKDVEIKYSKNVVEAEFDWIPMCLQKNVRLIVSLRDKNQAAILALQGRGQDSCEVIRLDVLPHLECHTILTQLPLQLTEEETQIILSKVSRDAKLPLYLDMVAKLLQLREQYSQLHYISRVSYLEKLPDRLAPLIEAAIVQAENMCGVDLVRRFLSLLYCSRGGLIDLELRELLVTKPVTAKAIVDSHRPLFNGLKYSALTNILSPILKMQRGPQMNGCSNLVELLDSLVAETVRQRYLVNFEKSREFHALLAKYYKMKSDMSYHPLCLKGTKEYIFHLTKARMWLTVVQHACTVHFMRKTFSASIAYPVMRDLIQCLFEITEYKALKTSDTVQQEQLYSVWLERMKEFCDFIFDSNTALTRYPNLTYQHSLCYNNDGSVYAEALEFFTNNPTIAHIKWLNMARAKIHGSAITSMTFANHDGKFATASTDKTCCIRRRNGDTELTLPNPTGMEVSICRFSSTSKYICLAFRDKTLAMYDSITATFLCRLQGHYGDITAVDMSCRGHYVGSGSEDRTLRVWDSESGTCLAIASHSAYCPSSSPFTTVVVVEASPQDETVWLTAIDRTVLVWRVNVHDKDKAGANEESVVCIKSFLAHTMYPVKFARFSMNAGHIISGCTSHIESTEVVPSEDTLVKVFSYSTGRVVNRCSAVTLINSYAINDSQSLLAISTHELIHVFDIDWESSVSSPDEVVELRPVATLKSSDKIERLAFSSNSKLVFSSSNALVQVWGLTEQRCVSEFMCQAPVTAIGCPPEEKDGGFHVADSSGRLYILHCGNC